MADENAARPAPLLADVLNQLATRDRIALVQHLNDSRAHARGVAEGLCGAEAPLLLTLPQVEAHLQAAIHQLERAAGVLGLKPEGSSAPVGARAGRGRRSTARRG
jgi:hypothetical protein